MSLVVWLPLTKDLRQQGLLDTAITNSGATYSATGGKLGGCYIFDGSDDSIGIGNLSTLVNTDFTFACWFYHDNTWSSKGYETLLGGPSGFELESKVSTTNSPVLKLYNWGGGSCIYELNKWNHVVFTRNTTETKLYLNGELQVTGTAGTIPSGNYFIGAWKTSAQQNFKGNMNDVRIYDHCLSPMEVKELSKGLVLHYPLNRNGFGVDNILNNTHFDSRYTQSTGWDTTKNGTQLASSWGGYNSGVTNQATVYHAHLKEFNGEWVYEYIKTANEGWLGIAQGGLQSKLTAGKIYTFSWEEYHVDGTNRVGTGLYYYKTGATSANFHLGIQQATEVTREIGKWQKYTYTFTAPNDADWSKSMNWYVYGHYNGNGTFYVRHIKLEEGSIPTPWCPNSSDTLAATMGLNSTTEYDCSGFCNNGTKTGTFTWTSDTPKYNVSTAFSGSQYITEDNEIETTDSTIAVWVKTSLSANAFILDCRNSSGAGKQPIYQYTNGSIQSGGASQYVTTNTGLLVANVWIHLTIVQSGSSLLVYKNGSLFQTLSCPNSSIIKPTVGARYSLSSLLPSGSISDLRIYATALSASDVKSLYQNCATIDPDGTIRGQIRS